MFPFKKKKEEPKPKEESRVSLEYDSHNFALASPYETNEIDENNLILSQNLRLGLDTAKTKRNLNAIYVGGSGGGKTRTFVLPNILQANSNYLICGLTNELHYRTKDFLVSQGYIVKHLNLMEPSDSMCYNPFKYIKTEIDIIKLSECLVKGIKIGGDPFFTRAEECLISALTYYMYKTYPRMEWSFKKLLELLDRSEVAMDSLFSELPNDSFGCQKYTAYKMGSETVRKSIMISVITLLHSIISEFDDILYKDEMNFEDFKNNKTAIFVSLPVCSSDYNCLGNLLIEQLYNYLINNYTIGDEIDELFLSMHKRKQVKSTQKVELKYHLNFILDDFCILDKIEELEKMLAISRAYNISFLLSANNLALIKAKGYDVYNLMSNNDSMIFLNSNEQNTIKYLNEEIFKEDVIRKIYEYDPFMAIPYEKCVIAIRGFKPYYDDKYNLITHKNYDKLKE